MQILAGLALAGAAGWNAFLPLLILGFANRFAHREPLSGLYGALANPFVLGALLVLLPVEIFADKIPGFDAKNDRAAAVYRPLAGAVAMAVATWQSPLPGVVAALIGAAVAFGMHMLKVRYRRPLGRVMGGVGQPVASLAEDFASVLVSFFALLVPALGFGLFVLVAALAAWAGSAIRLRAVTPNP